MSFWSGFEYVWLRAESLLQTAAFLHSARPINLPRGHLDTDETLSFREIYKISRVFDSIMK